MPDRVGSWSNRVGFSVVMARPEVASRLESLERDAVYAQMLCHLTGADPLALGRRTHW